MLTFLIKINNQLFSRRAAHQVLGVSYEASERQIKNAYYKLAKLHHPDMQSGWSKAEGEKRPPNQISNADIFNEVNKAYETMLSKMNSKPSSADSWYQQNEEPKDDNFHPHPHPKYKKHQNQSQKANPFKSTPKPNHSNSYEEEEYDEEDEEDFKANNRSKKQFQRALHMFINNQKMTGKYKKYATFFRHYAEELKDDGYKNSFENNFQFNHDEINEEEEMKANKNKRKKELKKLQIDFVVQLNPEEAKEGIKKLIKITRRVFCTTCNGNHQSKQSRCSVCEGIGIIFKQHKNHAVFENCYSCKGNGSFKKQACQKCKGRGHVKKEINEYVHIKAGSRNQDQIILNGKGHQHCEGDFYGDLLVKIKILQKDDIQYEGSNTFSDLHIQIFDAILGIKTSYFTSQGKKEILIKPGVQDGSLIKKKQEGVKKSNQAGSGDHFVKVHILIPKKLTCEEQEIYVQLQRKSRMRSVHINAESCKHKKSQFEKEAKDQRS